MRLSGVKGVKGVKELRQQLYSLSPLLMIFFSQETTFGGCYGLFMAFLQPVSDSYPCGRIPQNAALLLAKTSDGPPTIE